MSKQPEALRLAELLDESYPLEPEAEQAAAELRRLYALNQKLLASLKGSSNYIDHLGGDSSIYRQAITKAEEK